MQQLEKGTDVNLDDIHAALERRDKIDTERDVSPLKVAEDAIYIHTDDKTIDDVVEVIVQHLETWNELHRMA
jgi:cytidylate kinase